MNGEILCKGHVTDLSQPLEIDALHAAALADALKAAGYSRCAAADIIAELAKPGCERSYVGRVATSLLKRTAVQGLVAAWAGGDLGSAVAAG
ncbi:MAG TPA: hypothetical protein VGS19_35790 [Streptosporangiaceae bacterium]|nr:hypothetical protein [Streptosporangiaceae bacterium]